MNNSTNPAEAIRQTALSFPETTTGDSCNQTAFKVAKGTFLFIGPGAKGVGFKAMVSEAWDSAVTKDKAALNNSSVDIFCMGALR